MNVSLTQKLERLIKRKVASGMYTSASEVVREALRLLENHDSSNRAAMLRLREASRVGLDQIDRGETVEFDSDRLKRLGRQRGAVPKVNRGRKAA